MLLRWHPSGQVENTLWVEECCSDIRSGWRSNCNSSKKRMCFRLKITAADRKGSRAGRFKAGGNSASSGDWWGVRNTSRKAPKNTYGYAQAPNGKIASICWNVWEEENFEEKNTFRFKCVAFESLWETGIDLSTAKAEWTNCGFNAWNLRL